MRVVYDPVANGVGQLGIAERAVPVLDLELAKLPIDLLDAGIGDRQFSPAQSLGEADMCNGRLSSITSHIHRFRLLHVCVPVGTTSQHPLRYAHLSD